MYIKKLEIENIRSIKKLAWEVEESNCPGWHVFLGENGTGKTTLIRCICISICDKQMVYSLRLDWNAYKRDKKKTSVVSAQLVIDKSDSMEIADDPIALLVSQQGRLDIPDKYVSSRITIDNNLGRITREGPYGGTSLLFLHGAKITSGFFCCAYGPFRRFSGGENNINKEGINELNLDRFITAFGEEYVLSESLLWLKELRFKELENGDNSESSYVLKKVIGFINDSNFLPYNTKINKITSDGVVFVDGNNSELSVELLSDGYRSVLSLTFDIVRQLLKTFKIDEVFDKDDPTKIITAGVTLIDEVDAHLHPTWQKKIGFWFRRAFPNMQFIVTTHSPLVCQAAATGGSVYKLPAPGSDEEGRMLEGVELNKILYGDILDAYDTPAFGLPDTRSELGEDMIEELARLNRKERKTPLTPEEKERQAELRATFPALANE